MVEGRMSVEYGYEYNFAARKQLYQLTSNL